MRVNDLCSVEGLYSFTEHLLVIIFYRKLQLNLNSNHLNRTLYLVFVNEYLIGNASRSPPLSLTDDVYHHTLEVVMLQSSYFLFTMVDINIVINFLYNSLNSLLHNTTKYIKNFNKSGSSIDLAKYSSQVEHLISEFAVL